MIKHYLNLLRPHQWLKNAFCFFPAFFAGELFYPEYLISTIVLFVSFSLAASSIYCFNDMWDVEADRKHPKKCLRPIAAGHISIAQATVLMVVTLFLSVLILVFCSIEWKLPLAIIGVYYVINIAYCVKIKQIALLDVFIIAFGFVLRIIAGGAVTGIHISQWIVLVTFLLALFLALAKRRDDVVIYETTAVKVRKNVNRYNLYFMNQAISLIASVVVICYIMYTVSDEVTERLGTHYLYLTSIFVLAGILRYLQLTIVDVKSGSPTKILMKDLFIQICILGWIITFAFILYTK